jgi:hypothetical protein
MAYRQTIAIDYKEPAQIDLVLDDIKAAVDDKIEVVTAEAIDAFVQESVATLSTALTTQITAQQAQILALETTIYNLTNPP